MIDLIYFCNIMNEISPNKKQLGQELLRLHETTEIIDAKNATFEVCRVVFKTNFSFLQDKIQECIFWQNIDNQKPRITEVKFGNGAHEMRDHDITHFLQI